MDCESYEMVDDGSGAGGVRVGDPYFGGILEGVEGDILVVILVVVGRERKNYKATDRKSVV